jgi:Zinc-binding loop region of homing endonuclease
LLEAAQGQETRERGGRPTAGPIPLTWWPYCLAHLKGPPHSGGQPALVWPQQGALLPKMLDAINAPSPLASTPSFLYEYIPIPGEWNLQGRRISFADCPEGAYLYHLLEVLAEALEVSETRTSQGYHINPFLYPPRGACIVYDHKRRHPGMMVDRSGGRPGYLRMDLGRGAWADLGEEGRCIEAAHRVVLLATQGPPPPSEEGTVGHDKPLVCYHTCHNKACLNPFHLAWATYHLNNMRPYTRGRNEAFKQAERDRLEKVKDLVEEWRDKCMRDRKLRSDESPWLAFAVLIHHHYRTEMQRM